MPKLHCRECGERMQRWGYTKQNKPRFYCPTCRISATPQRNDVERRKSIIGLRDWLLGKESLSQIATHSHVTRQALWKRFHRFMKLVGKDPTLPDVIRTRFLIVDGTYIHGHILCILVAIDENDKLYWRFAPYESYKAWCGFLSSFAEPEVIIMDGQKGLFAAARTLWPKVAIQRCQFHLISFAIQYIGRRPKEDIGKDLLNILYRLKYAKSHPDRLVWLDSYHQWERTYESFLSAKDRDGNFYRPRLRSARLIIRRALPYLFTYLDHSGSPNTTNLVEGWVNGAMAEALRLHRGLRIHEKKALATIILTNLRRRKDPLDAETERAEIAERLRKVRRDRDARRFKKRYSNKRISKIVEASSVENLPLGLG